MEEHTKPKLLLIDDDQFLLNMYSTKFTTSGFEVSTIANSGDALDKLRAGLAPDIILLDIIMPGLDGLELLEAVRKEGLAKGAAIIMLTNQGDGIDKAKELGVEGYIVKATTIPSEVVAEVSAIMKNRAK